MKKLLAIIMAVCILFMVFMFTSCSPKVPPGTTEKPGIISSKYVPQTAEELVVQLKEANLPIGSIMTYTEVTDVNELLGRPNQYISKSNFEDSRLEQTSKLGPTGGSIETFNNTTDLNNRKVYLETVSSKLPILTEYMYVKSNYLLRLNKNLTPKQVDEYVVAFNRLE